MPPGISYSFAAGIKGGEIKDKEILAKLERIGLKMRELLLAAIFGALGSFYAYNFIDKDIRLWLRVWFLVIASVLFGAFIAM